MTRVIRLVAFLAALALIACSNATPSVQAQAPASAAAPAGPSVKWGMVIHTGAGNFTLASLGDRREPERAAMNDALMAGYKILSSGGTSLDAVQAAIVIFEDNPLFNAGKGAVSRTRGRTNSTPPSWTVRR